MKPFDLIAAAAVSVALAFGCSAETQTKESDQSESVPQQSPKERCYGNFSSGENCN